MSKFTKKIIQVLMIVSVVVVLVVGIIALEYFVKDVKYQKNNVMVNNPEKVIDQQIIDSGKNYTEQINDDGTVTRKISLNSISYKNNEGTYLPINTFINSSDNGNYENATNIFKTYFEKDITSESFISYRFPGQRGLNFTFTEANQSEWEVTDNQAIYSNIYDSVDVQYTTASDSLIERFIVLNKDGTTKIEQIVKLEGIYYKEHDNGSITLHDLKTKNIVLLISPPIMYEKVADSVLDENPGNLSTGLHYEVSKLDNGTIIISRVIDEAGIKWLEMVARHPVIIETKYAGPLSFGESGQLWKYYDSQSTTEKYFLDSFATKFKIGKYQFPIQYNCNGCRKIINFRALLSFVTGGKESNINKNQIKKSSLVVYMHRSGSSVVENELSEEVTIPLYIGSDIWDVFSDGQSVWQSGANMDIAGNVYMTDLPLDMPKTLNACLATSEKCRREIELDINMINLSKSFGKTQFVFSEENIELEIDGKFSGVYAIGLISSLDPELQIIYTP